MLTIQIFCLGKILGVLVVIKSCKQKWLISQCFSILNKNLKVQYIDTFA